ncbi:transcriptional regulator, LacI family [Marinobacter sp. DSM 26671]|jgi:LacI family fructose operon transcriptional repressor|uniref:catabolite repressor/activator n=1 Tax=unclassified Marinobacter TaxID=83889 RepID=UPI00069F780C|nr:MULTISPECIES: catabolite repressor/activator [unclassified Marinobacter]AKV96317.1 transcriptional regulator [Marinobacter sp. CP1]SFE16198.1 transcriptional regulator, LacI family [Marinobacter sp. DSM 26671]|tara:strand:+ start:1800 stop:2834 length:1035 start_codon:yes stop_codon:yes gene_type:complete
MTLVELARLAGVSRTTASYVINGQGAARRIKQDTIEKVLTVARKHNFQVDTQAAALRGGASRTLGFILPDLENTSYARLAKLLEQGARARGYQLLIAGSDDDPETEKSLARALKARRCDALIVASALALDDPFYPQLQKEGLPVIAVDRAQSPDKIRCVVSDNRSAAEILTRSVLGGKTASIAWLDAVPEIAMTRERREGFLAAANEAGIAPLVESGLHYDRASGAAMMRRILTDHGLPDALVTASFTLLQGVLDVLLDQPDPLPKALKIATFGDDRLLDFLPLAVNSLPQDHEAIANATLEQALSAIAQEGPVDTIVINRSLKTRAADRQSRPVQTTSAEKTC